MGSCHSFVGVPALQVLGRHSPYGADLRSWWRKALIIAAAVPLAIEKNGLRIFVIAELGTRVDRGFLDGNLHHHGGIVFLGIAMVVVVALIWFLHRWEVRRPIELRARLS